MMHGGELIYETSDEYGKIQVIDFQQQYRSLHFGNRTQQSAMLLKNPYVLIHKYTQAMVLPLSWLHAERVLMLGLGGGSIAKYIYNYFLNIDIHSVEIRENVISIATEYFLLPDQSDRFIIDHQCSSDWLANRTDTDKYDAIFVDLFLTTKSGKDRSVDFNEELEKLIELLNEHGCLIFNHLGRDATNNPVVRQLQQAYSWLYIYSINIDEFNSIVICSKQPVPACISDDHFYEFEKQYSSPYKQYFDKLQRL